MPFITEEVWHGLDERNVDRDIIIEPYPEEQDVDTAAIENIDFALDVITKIREIRNNQELKQTARFKIKAKRSGRMENLTALPGWLDIVQKLARVDQFDLVDQDPTGLLSFVVGTDKFFVDLGVEVDIAAEMEKVKKELEYQRGFTQSAEKKLSNERFVSGAPEAVVEKERKKLADGKARIAMLEESLRNLEKNESDDDDTEA